MEIFKRKNNQWEHYIGPIGPNGKDFSDIENNWEPKEFEGVFEFGELKYYNQDCSQKDVWYSYDYGSKNIHIAPGDICEEIRTKNYDEFKKDFETECGNIIKQKKEFKNLRFYSSKMEEQNEGQYFVRQSSKPQYTKNHLYRYLRPQYDGFEYLILVNRYWCSDGDNDKTIVNCEFGSFQFMRNRIVYKKGSYKEDLSNINYDSSNKFQIMYPYTKEDEYCVYNPATGHCVYNSSYHLDSNSEDVAKGFIDFVLGFKKHNNISLDINKIKGIEIRNA